MNKTIFFSIFSGLFLLSACTVGTDFVAPELPTTKTYSKAALPNSVVIKEMPALWWQLFNSDQLSALILKAMQHNSDLEAARATLTQANKLANAKESDFYPSADIHLSSKRMQTSGAQFGRPDMSGTLFNLYSASVSVSYTLDLFGGMEREWEGLLAEADYQKFQLDVAFLTLSSNIVQTVIEEATLREQITLIEQLIQLRTEQLNIVKQQASLGATSQVEVLAQQTALEQERANLPELAKKLQQNRHHLAVLVGDEPSHEAAAQFTFKNLKLPKELPVSLPAQLVAQRPDIRAQSALLHKANANIGFVTSKMFPDISLSADLGTIASHVGDWFMPGSAIWSAGNTLLQPLFRAGKNLRQRDAAIAAYQAVAAKYRSSVLTAMQSVADVLTALKHDADALTIQQASVDSAKASLDLAKTQYQTGSASYLSLLNAQNAYQQSQLGLIKARGLQLSDTALLFSALGGSWWQRPALPALPIKSMPVFGD